MSLKNLLGLFLCALAALIGGLSASPPDTAFAAGNSITSPDTTGDIGRWASLRLDGFGFPVVSYYNRAEDRLKVLHCGDANCIAGNSIVTPDPNTGLHTSLRLDSSGFPVVSYWDADAGTNDLKVLHCNDANCAGGDESITSPDTGGNVGQWTSLALDGSGNPVVSYRDFTNNDLKVLHCNDANCAGGDESITTPDSAGVVGSFTSLALDSGGNPVVSYCAQLPSFLCTDLKVLHCNDANCAGGDESITSPDTGGDVGGYTSLALDASGYPVVSYHDYTDTGLKVLHCNDANCAGGDESITSPDTAGVVGGYTSLRLDSSGNPVVSYCVLSVFTCEDLKVLHCGNPNCTAGNSITSPDTGGMVGESALALDISGNPVVSYYDTTNGNLKLLHCSDTDCTGDKPVGGIAELPQVDHAPLDEPASSGRGSAAAPIAGATGAAAVLASAVWYARRRSRERPRGS